MPTIADFAACDLLAPEGGVRGLAIEHVEKAELARDPHQRSSSQGNGYHGAANVIRTGEAEHTRDITDALADATLHDSATTGLAKSLDLRSPERCRPEVRYGWRFETRAGCRRERGRR